MYRIDLAQNRDRSCDFVNALINPRVPSNRGNTLKSSKPVTFL